jgi:hypothetical protein
MSKRILLQDTQLLDRNREVRTLGTVAIASAESHKDYQYRDGDPLLSSCWLMAIVVAEEAERVDYIRQRFGQTAGINPDELKNVISVKPEGGDGRIAQALQELSGGPQLSKYPQGGIHILSCSIGGKDAMVYTGAYSSPSSFKADWVLAKGTVMKPDPEVCLCNSVSIWTRPLDDAEKAEFANEVPGGVAFSCE